MNSILDNSIWPNLNGELGSITTPIPDGVTVKWPDGDALVGNFVYKDGKLVGFVDSKALIPNDTKTSNLPYDCVHTSFERILDGDFTFDGARKNHFEIKCSDLVNFAKINLSEILSDVKFVIDLDDSSENKLVVHTDRVDDSKLEEVSTTLSNVLPANIEVVQYNHNIELSWREIHPDIPPLQSGKYDRCVSVAEMAAVNANFRGDFVGDGVWAWPVSELEEGFTLDVKPVKAMWIYGPKLKTLIDQTWQVQIKEIYCYAPNAKSGYFSFNSPALIKLRGDFSSLQQGFLCYECRLLQDAICEFPSLSNGKYMFQQCQLNKASVLSILNSLPSLVQSSPFEIGIHVDYQNDEEVLAAIANAEAKGWTLTVQWNGTATAATASTFGFGQLIYAKVSEMERPDGTTERVLDWGHYVTNPEGYETFRSLESAYEYFGLEMSFIGN